MVKVLFIALLTGTLTLIGFSYNQKDKKYEIQSQIQTNLETAQITSPHESNNHNQLLSNMEIHLLESFVDAEGENETQIVKTAIAAVVLNRLKDATFPKSVDRIIFQPGQFSSVTNGKIWSIQSDDSARNAVFDAINGFDPTGGCTYYYNPKVSIKPTTYSPVKQIGNYVFCKVSPDN